jgi:hypothetical protein
MVDLSFNWVEINFNLLQIELFELDKRSSHVAALVGLAMDDSTKHVDQTLFSNRRPLDWQSINTCAFP